VTRTGLRFLVFALFTWTLCFVVLQQLGTWTPFAFVGLVLAILAVSQRVVPRSLLRPSLARTTVGIAGGALMVVGTHLAYRAVVTFAPSVAGATRQLLVLLNVAGFSPAGRALLIVLIASCEEVLFRGILPSFTTGGSSRPHWPSSRELAQIVALAAVYALTTLPLGSGLLVLCAFACGSLWGLMRVATGSLVVPLLAHVIWDLGVLLVWPLAG
jgi:membrane protease YdiL (CAAX protease family)